MTNFDIAFYYLLGDEGKRYTNDPDDAGGPTKFGITKETYESFFGKQVDDSEIANMTEDTAKQIYTLKYWHKVECERLKSLPISIALFDSCVLYGTFWAAKLAQLALSFSGATLKIDGVIGDMTVRYLNNVKDEMFIKAFRDQILKRIDEVIEIAPTNEKYRHGWTNRADRYLSLLSPDVIAQLTKNAQG